MYIKGSVTHLLSLKDKSTHKKCKFCDNIFNPMMVKRQVNIFNFIVHKLSSHTYN